MDSSTAADSPQIIFVGAIQVERDYAYVGAPLGPDPDETPTQPWQAKAGAGGGAEQDKAFVRDKFIWLKQATRDADLQPSALRFVNILFCCYLNREKGYAWPSIDTLAADLKCSERSVQRMIAALVERGHLSVEMGGGRKNTNHYRFVLKAETVTDLSGFKPETVTDRVGNGDSFGMETATDLSLDSIEENPIKRVLDVGLFPSCIIEPSPTYSPISPKLALARAEFSEKFWPAYPHKVGKGAAEKSFLSARKRTDLDQLMSGLESYRQSNRPWCNPSTWLNQDRWLDKPAFVAPRTNGNGASRPPEPPADLSDVDPKTLAAWRANARRDERGGR